MEVRNSLQTLQSERKQLRTSHDRSRRGNGDRAGGSGSGAGGDAPRGESDASVPAASPPPWDAEE